MLIFSLEKEHQANYSIEGSIKESRLLNRFAKDGRTRQVVLECRDKGWCCIYPEDLKSFFDQYYPSVDGSNALRAKIRHSSRITGNPEHSRLGLPAPSATAFDRSRPLPPVRLHSETHFPPALCVSTRAHDADIVSPCETSTSFQPLRPWQPFCSPHLRQATPGHVLHYLPDLPRRVSTFGSG
jgi:hypothetical protein